MERFPRSSPDAESLLQLVDLLKQSANTVIEEWKKEDFTKGKGGSQDTPAVLPSHRLHQAQRTILAITGALVELVAEPYSRIQEVGCQYFESRALFIAAERRIPDLLAEAGESGLEIDQLAAKTGIEASKLARILRCLCSIHIFREIGPGRFANNRISAALVHNEPLRAYVQLFNLDIYNASDQLPKYLLSDQGASYDVRETAFQRAVNTTKARWDWLAERVSPAQIQPQNTPYPGVPDVHNWNLVPGADGLVGRPELENFGLAMVGGGKVTGTAHAFDYPWADLGEAVVVDVGGRVGGFALQLLPVYPKLRFIIQDRAEVLEQAQRDIWPREAPEAVRDGRVTFMVHDFFKPNPVQGAAIYWLRGILHDWSDSYCVQILSALREALSPSSRILICDQVMNTTYGSPDIPSAPSPLPANYGYYVRYCHHRDLGLMSIINGIERTPAEFEALVKQAGLRIIRIWECRSMVGIVEVGL
ncbi:O-methyltransferase [Rasamsonia emersonii CBS 393.64]|uniref:O-methyltransferase n=1 Tax=Rasamsonia emersonii (strain ATCC 16479 / CBS 393.64 / IMI 116815) TaxID=1408163 RepID=A0A0F4Z3I0_RASE3|nr:O-methyltransferase [Rasamsonia emersonii CBS 393.64]KKA24443.1 O-methyltransferase [Rasamsonia emersonii CBS 393.64]